MQGCRMGGWLAGIAFALLAAGCQSSSGGSLATGSGPSRDFGLRAPSQSEPPVEDALAARKTARRSEAADNRDEPTRESSSGSANRRASWRTGKDQPPAEPKSLPVSDSADSEVDDLEM